MGLFGVIRVDSSGELAGLGSVFPTSSLALIANDGTGAASLQRWNGSAWVAVNISGITATSVTLAGDVIGPSGTNVVAALTGTAGTIAVHGNVLAWDANRPNFQISQLDQSTNTQPPSFILQLSAPFASATGINRNAPSGTFTIPAPVASGSDGRWIFSVSGNEILSIEASRVYLEQTQLVFKGTVGPVALQHEARSGAGNALLVVAQNSTDNVGGPLILSSGNGGGGNLPGDITLRSGPTDAMAVIASSPQPIVHFYGNTVRWSATSSPVLMQQQRQNDTGIPQPLRFRSQDPYAGATNHGGGNDARLAGNMEWEIGTSVNGADQLGHYVWSIAEAPVMKGWIDRLELYDVKLHFVYSGSAPLIDVSDATSGAGAPILIIGGRGFDARGGDVMVKGGVGGSLQDGGGFIAEVGDTGQPMLQVQQLGSKYVTAIGFPNVLTNGDVQANNSNYLLLGNTYNLDSTLDLISGPTGGVLLASHGGQFLFQNTDKTWVRFESYRPAGTPGASLGVYDVTIDTVPCCIEVFAR